MYRPKKENSGPGGAPEKRTNNVYSPISIHQDLEAVTAEVVADHYRLIREEREFVGECILCHYPKPSWRVRDKHGRLVMSCWNCQQHLTLFNRALAGMKTFSVRPSKEGATTYLQSILDDCVSAQGTVVNTYLSQRGFVPLFPLPPSVLFHPNLRYDNSGSFPAMVAKVIHHSGSLMGLQRLWLTTGGQKAPVACPRKSLGHIRGGSVHLANFDPEEPLGLCEGVETGLACMAMTGIPVWACLSVAGLEGVVLPSEATQIVIFADHDDNGVGLKAARTLAARLMNEGRQVEIRMPDVPGDDFNDLLIRQQGEVPRG